MDIGGLASGVQQARSRIDDLHVTFVFNAIDPPPGLAKTRVRQEVYLRGWKLLSKEESGQFRTEFAFNGSASTLHLAHARKASVSVGEASWSPLIGSGFFDLAMLHEPGRSVTEVSTNSLLGVLRAPGARVRLTQEMVDGRWCHVVDLPMSDAPQPTLSVTVWIDAERGFVPLRQQHFAGNGALACDFHATQVTEFGSGVWLPIEGTKISYPTARGLRAPLSYTMEVEVVDGRPALELNSAFDDDVFNLFRHLPVGTMTVLENGGISAVVGEARYNEVVTRVAAAAQRSNATGTGETGFLTAAPAPLVVTAPSATQARASASNFFWWALVGSACILAAAAGLVLRRRRHLT